MSELQGQILNFIADFGETIVLFPPLAAISLYLALSGAARLAVAWFCAFVLCAALAGAFKALGWPPVSGHADISLAFYGGLAVLLWRTAARPSAGLRAVGLGLFGTAGLITWSIWMLRWHDIEAIACGLLVGGLSPLAILVTPGTDILPRKAPVVVVVIALLLIISLHGLRLNYTYAGGKVIRALERI